jgi:cbb3-type cytochrome oxidase subunit 3
MAEGRNPLGEALIRLANVDIRYIQLILLILMVLPLLMPLGLPLPIKPTDQLFYERIESYAGTPTAAPTPAADSWPGDYNRPVILWNNDIWFGTFGSYKAGMKIWFEHIMRSDMRLVVMATSDTYGGECEATFRKMINEEVDWTLPWMADKAYGDDWIELGWIPGQTGGANWGLAAEDIHTAVSGDLVNGQPISSYPAFANVHGIDTFDIGIHMTPGTGAAPTLWWATYGGRQRQQDVMICAGADQEAWSHSWYMSGQVYSYLAGIPSFASLESLVGVPGDATISMETISTTGVYWIILILIGNGAYLYAKRTGREAEQALKRY